MFSLQVVRTTVTSCHLKCRNLENCVAYGTLTNVMMGNNILSDKISADKIIILVVFPPKIFIKVSQA